MFLGLRAQGFHSSPSSLCWPLSAGVRRSEGAGGRGERGKGTRWRGNEKGILVSSGATDYQVRRDLLAAWLPITENFLPVVPG